MMFSSLPSTLCLALLTALASADSPSCKTSTLTIHAWPLSSSKPSTLAEVAHKQCPGVPSTYTLASWTPPPHQSAEYDLVRVGRYDRSAGDAEKTWDGILTAASSLAPELKKTLVLHTGLDGQVSHIGLTASSAGLKNGENEVDIETKPIESGPTPFLNKPIVLDETGKMKTEQKDERTFLQKYWWVLAIFLVMQLVAGGPKE